MLFWILNLVITFDRLPFMSLMCCSFFKFYSFGGPVVCVFWLVGVVGLLYIEDVVGVRERIMDDPFDEEPMPAVTRVRAGGRFQPRGKQTLVRSTSPDDGGKRKAVSQTSNAERLVQPVVDVGDVGKRMVDDRPVGLSLQTSQMFGTKEGVMHSERALGENAGAFYGSERFDNFTSESAVCGADAGDNVGTQAQSSLALMVHDGAQEDTCPGLFTTGDPGNCSEAAVFNNDGATPFDSGRLETQQGGAFLDTDTLEFVSEEAIASGGHAVKYKPKPKVRFEKEKPSTGSTDMPQPEAFESVLYPPNSQLVSSETACMSEGSIPFFPPDDVYDYSSIDLGDIIPPDPTTAELPMNAEPTNLPENYHADNTTSGGVPQMLEKPPRKPIAVPELVDELDDEAHDNSSFFAEPPDSTVREDGSNIDGHEEESKTKKKAPRKSKKPVTESEKPVRKRNKANEASDESTKEGPKKFSHSTRRKRRHVNKELLQTPEDEIDPQKVSMKDLILLAEYRERLASKEAKRATTPLTNQSTENYFQGENYQNEEQTFASEQGNASVGDQATHGTDSGPELYNYHSFMKNKTPTIRWSKQETEVFYEAIRKFGTDLSTIQQLFFPERSRHQVKLKYKKEEREHPLRLTEALTNRAKDHSHFEKAIEQLKKVAAQIGRDTNGDDSIGMTGKEATEDLTTEINDEVEKFEQEENGEAADVAEVQSPPKADDESEDGINYWDSYECKY